MSDEKIIVNSWNEWDPLKHVIVGKADGTCIPAPEPALDAKVPEDSDMRGKFGPRTKDTVDKANQLINDFSDTLRKRGIKVDRPDPIDFNQKTSTPDWEAETMFGLSLLQGKHQEAQKSINTIFPLRDDNLMLKPLGALKSNSGALFPILIPVTSCPLPVLWKSVEKLKLSKIVSPWHNFYLNDKKIQNIKTSKLKFLRTHDFTSFSKISSNLNSRKCNIYESSWYKKDNLLVYKINFVQIIFTII